MGIRLVTLLALGALTGHAAAWSAEASSLDDHQARALEIFRELVEIDTTHSTGDNTRAARVVAERLLEAGFPEDDVHVIEPAPGKGNLVARLRSPAPTAKPILVLAHLDVVEADPDDWSVPPFELLERGGYYYGRGTTDDKDEAAIYSAIMLRLKEEGYRPNRDIILALTADEEGGTHNGVDYLLTHHRELVDAAFVLNEGGGGIMRGGERIANAVQAAEKVYQTYQLEVTNPGGHSALPRPDNAIYQLAKALLAVAEHEFPVKLNEVTRTFLRESMITLPPEQRELAAGLLEEPPRRESIELFSRIPSYNAALRTTCVATELAAGHAENALPQRARATVNCRILPDVDPEVVQDTLARVIDDAAVEIIPLNVPTPSPPSPLTEEVMAPIREVTEAMWPGVVVVPSMTSGATDGLYFRRAGIPVYGVSGVFTDLEDVRAHGKDERILAEAFYDALEFLERLLRAYTSG